MILFNDIHILDTTINFIKLGIVLKYLILLNLYNFNNLQHLLIPHVLFLFLHFPNLNRFVKSSYLNDRFYLGIKKII